MPQKFLSIKNFEKYQHFKKANPPWIKLYRSMLTDREFMQLSTSCKYLYIGLIIIVSEGSNRVPHDVQWISRRLSINVSEIDLNPLYKAGFLIASRSTLYRQSISQRRDRDRDREETPIVPLKGTSFTVSDFDHFWAAYPKKTGKKAALHAWGKAKNKPPLVDMIQVIEKQKNTPQWTKESGQFIPNPSTWLNQGRWDDEIEPAAQLGRCNHRIYNGNFLKDCGEPSGGQIGGQPRCQKHKEEYESRISRTTT